jgi:TetR/AcrR family transcriptional regulator, regulator of biofilm formation and stress response
LSRPGTRARGAARRRAIVEAALTLLGRGGSGAVTHRSVAAEADVPLAATTYYFATKDELVVDAFALAMTEDVAALGAIEPLEADDPPTVPQVAAWLVSYLLTDLADDRATRLVLFELEVEAARRPELAPLSRAWTDAYVRAVSPTLARLGSTDPDRDGWIVVTALAGMELELLASGERDAEAVLLPAVERLLGALVE